MPNHNSFDVIELTDGRIECRSHNFPPLKGVGKDLIEAHSRMDEAIRRFMVEKPEEYKALVNKRLKKNLQCLCGLKLNSPVVAILK